MCKDDLESTDHLLLCLRLIVRNLWELALSCLGLYWVIPNYVKHQLLVLEGFFWGRRVKYNIFRAMPCAIFWSLWMERNRRVVDGVKTSIEQLTASGSRPFFWTEEVFGSSWIDVIDVVGSLFFSFN